MNARDDNNIKPQATPYTRTKGAIPTQSHANIMGTYNDETNSSKLHIGL